MKDIIPLSISLISAVIVQVLCQITKFISYSLRDKALGTKYLFTAGGMPSSHSAFVTALSVSIGLWNGFQTDLFAVSCVFAAIIIYDAYRLRGTVQTHSRIIKKLMILLPEQDHEEVEEMVGHTIPEIIAGILTGGIFAWLLF
ncbi:MAG: divergent PAP2 family protein, partial [Spirochaetales bacterium]|nr:divergent PAP2 family protein [Spirochaetales bacterium]